MSCVICVTSAGVSSSGQDNGFWHHDRRFESYYSNQPKGNCNLKRGDILDVKLLKSKMVLHGDEDFVKKIAEILDISRQTASAKLNGKSEFTRDQMKLISEHYRMSDDDIRKIFIEGDRNNESERSSETIG